jgi:peptidoglycan hydrolase-like protein with peptidoglycan-binding domain
MKKIFITSIVALALIAASAGSANAQNYVFSNYLRVGSTGADVSALQTWLVNNGFDIPAVSSGAAAKGYFGQQTKAAVVRYQASVGLPATGFVGPLTVAKLNGTGGAVVVAPVTCPIGYTCTANPGTTPVTVTPGSPFVADGQDGSITLSSSSYVSSTQTLKKGDMDKPIISVTAKASVGNVNVNRFDIHFNSRPWLLFSRVVLKDVVSGRVLATKTLSSAADVTEITVGSDYLVRFDNVNAVVTPAQDTTFVVTADVLAASDKITGQTVTVSTDTNGIRTINGKGYTDSTGLAQTNSIVLSATGSTGDLLSRVGLNTPETRTVSVSTTSVTPDQVLGEFDIKLQNQSGTMSAVNFLVNVATSTYESAHLPFLATNVFQNFRLYSGSQLLGGAYSVSAANPATVTFVNLNVPLTVEQWKSLTLKADVLATSTAISASSTIDVSTIVGVDANFNTITLSNASDRTSNNVTLVPNAGITITAITPVKGSVTTPTTGVWLAAYPSISFTINNTGSNPIYISKTASTALATTTSSGASASTTVTSVTASGSTTGDTSTSYIINGSRTFTYNFYVDNKNGDGTSKKISITQINYGTAGGSGTDNTLNVNYGLENAYVQVP